MKLILNSLLLLALVACKSSSTTPQKDSTLDVLDKAEKQATTSQNETSNPTGMLLGIQDRAALEREPHDYWFNDNYDSYEMDTEAVAQLQPLLEDVKIKAFMGTWCGDSQYGVPAFYKIMDEAKFDYNNLTLITVTRNKDTPEKLEEGLNIIRVPTFIFYKDGKELGRYVEYARESLEKDMITILSGETYKHSYED
ncbi:thioredoxin family protein [Aquimarina intermedia]|uniref:Thiol-disulfide isomerase/thioredoxin n=1 Tax=Aquimarina intermedia TaxID=350814 RepID=A0A5S5BUB2_9FLAO|nr:thioredoxin family protein [Aquimarina intermedia]TYP69886.1 thiol-disulfide isomerase/thioredoxin [Aquimarina intermedia]